jgi:hypothetical protein
MTSLVIECGKKTELEDFQSAPNIRKLHLKGWWLRSIKFKDAFPILEELEVDIDLGSLDFVYDLPSLRTLKINERCMVRERPPTLPPLYHSVLEQVEVVYSLVTEVDPLEDSPYEQLLDSDCVTHALEEREYKKSYKTRNMLARLMMSKEGEAFLRKDGDSALTVRIGSFLVKQ